MSWEQLVEVYRENAELCSDDPAVPDTCPHDGTPLDVRDDGVRHCRWGDYRYPD